MSLLACCVVANPLPAHNEERTLIGTLGKDKQITIHAGYAAPADEPASTPSTAPTTLEKRDSFTCPNLGVNPDGDDCSQIYNELRNNPDQVWTLNPREYIEFNWVSCRLRVQNRDTCVGVLAHGSGIAYEVNSMLQCPYNWGASAIITLDNPPIMLIMTGQGDDLPPYPGDPNCTISHDELWVLFHGVYAGGGLSELGNIGDSI